MSYTDLTTTTGSTIATTWGNSVRDRVVNPLASAAARDSAISSPAEGMLEYLKDVDQFTFYTGARWTALPGTIIARGNRTSSSSTTTTEVGVIRISASLKSGQTYFITTSPLRMNSTASDYVFGRIRFTTDGSTPSTSSTILSTIVGPTGFAQTTTPFLAKYVPSSDITFGCLLTTGRFAGTGTCGLITDSSNPDIDLMIVAAGTDPTDTGTDI